MDILLINPFLSKTDFESPLGLLYIAQACSAAGHNVKVLDLSFEYDLGYLARYVNSHACDVAGIYSMSPMIGNALLAAGIVKQAHPGARTVFGGPHPTLFPEEVLREESVDFCVVGEGEDTIADLLLRLQEGGKSYSDIKGVAFKEQGKIMVNPRRELIQDLDTLPFPDRNKLTTLEGYLNLAGIKVMFGLRTANLIASRGCPFTCAFCQPALSKIHGGRVRQRSVDNVIAEIDYLRKNWRIGAVWFEDDTFTLHGDWVGEFCVKLPNAVPGIFWSCNSRLDMVDEGMLKNMKRAGCAQIRYGLESGSQPVLDEDFGKGISLSKAADIFALTRSAGIKTYAYVMIGGRHETLLSVEQTKEFLRQVSPDHAQIAITTPLPGTRMEKEMEQDRGVVFKSRNYADIRLFERCNFDTVNLKAEQVEDIHRQVFNATHFFKLSRLLNVKLFSWLVMTLRFSLFLIASKDRARSRYIMRFFWSHLVLAFRLVMLHVPLLKRADKAMFKTRLSFPYL